MLDRQTNKHSVNRQIDMQTYVSITVCLQCSDCLVLITAI